MTHVGGRIVLCSMSSGVETIIEAKFNPQTTLRTIQDERINMLFLPSAAMYALLAQPNVRDFDYSSLRSFAYGASPTVIERLKEAIDIFGPVMNSGFGQTESPTFITSMHIEDHFVDGKVAPDERLRSVGRASVLTEVAIMDDDGNLLGANEKGEIVLKGANVSLGYYENPEATAAIRRDGWHLTGDIGYLDEDGYLYIVDRKKDMIITGGFNVYSVEVENCINQLSAVNLALVIGVPSAKWGEEVKALVKLQKGATISEEAIIQHCKAALGGVKAPKSVEFIEVLPLTAVGKINKKALRDPYWAGYDSRTN